VSTPATTSSDYNSDPANDPMIGRSLDGRYTIHSRLGKGSMGTVYRARQTVMDRDVAIKVLRQDRALDESSKARFFREARATSVLHSPHTVTVFDFGQTTDGDLYLAMQILDGESLGQRLARIKRFPVEDAIEATRQVLRSLAEAHAKGIIHRDLKPDNIFFAKVVQGASTGGADRHDEIVKVLDFGIAKLTHPGEPVPGVSAVETQAGTVFGTPRYMSPEQAQGKPLDHRTDLYSLGVMLYQMLTGRPPFTDQDAVVVMARHIRTVPKSPREVAPDLVISDQLEALVMRALAKDAKDRPHNAEAMSAALAEARDSVLPTTSGMRRSARSLSEPPPAPDDSDPTTNSLESSAYDAVESRRRTTRWVSVGIVGAILASLGVVAMAHPFGPRPAPLLVTGNGTTTGSDAITGGAATSSAGGSEPQAVPTVTTATSGGWIMVTDGGGVPLALEPEEIATPPLAPVSDLPPADPASAANGASSHIGGLTSGGRPPAHHRNGPHAPNASTNPAASSSKPPKPASSSGYDLFE
jgi:serine/threonine-protein kinase